MKKVYVCCAVLLVCAVGAAFGQSNTDLAQAAFDRGVAATNQENYDLAMREYTEAIRLNPNFWQSYLMRGAFYADKKDWDAAISDCTQAIQLNAEISIAYYLRGCAYYEKDDYDRAIADLTQAIRLDPNDANVYYYRGYSYLQRGMTNQNSSDINSAGADADALAWLEPNGSRGANLKAFVDGYKKVSWYRATP